MQIASRYGSVPMLEVLKEHGGLLSSRGPKGDTLFHLAAYNGHVETMKWLHSVGILPEAVDMFGQTVAHVAARRGEINVLKYLHYELNMNIFEQEDFDGRTPLQCIPKRGPPELQECREFLDTLGFDEEHNLNVTFAKIYGYQMVK